MKAGEVAALLARDAEGIARMLLPSGKRSGAEWETGSADGDAGKSCKVHLSGEKAGVWRDFAAEEGGDLLDLWARAKGIGIGDAIRQAKAHLGISEQQFAGHQPKSYRKPDRPEYIAARNRVGEYLKSRSITPEAVKAYKVVAGKADDEIIFPYLRGGELLNVKYLKLDRPNGKKLIRLEKDCEPCLFGWQAIPEDARTVALCEGEMDALTLWQYGIPALSVFSGAGNHTWIENEFDNLERFDTIFLVFDRDEAGEKGMRELVNRLGRERCKAVHLPYKDANECLVRGMPEDAMREVFAHAATLDPAELKPASSFVDEVIGEFYPPEGEEPGFATPWRRLDGKVRFRPAELCIVNGVNGHGKSQLVGQIMLSAMEQGQRCCVASMEIKPRMQLMRLARQASAVHEPSIPYIREIHKWYSDRLWMFDVVGNAKAARILEVFAYARKRYGIGVFVIDSMAKCGIADDDRVGEKAFIDALTDFKNEHECNVFLVTHSRKGEAETKPTDKMDVKGSGTITDMADMLLNIWRNKPKEDLLERGEQVADMPDAFLACQKNRNGDWEGKAGLYYDRACYQFTEQQGRARPYVERQEAVAI